MSTHETFLQRADCYCGKGYVERELHSPDNPYSRSWTGEPKLNCTACSLSWVFRSDDVMVPNPCVDHEQGAVLQHRLQWKLC